MALRDTSGKRSPSSRNLAGKIDSGSSDSILARIDYLAQFKQRAVTLQQLFEFGLNSSLTTVLTSAQFLHQELPVRLAHRVKELENLPFGLSDMPSVKIVTGMYVDSVRELIEVSCPENAGDERAFTAILENIKQRHNNVVALMAKGIFELKQKKGPDAVKPEVQEFLDSFHISRIGIRMLIGQQVALHQPPRPGYVGLICERCSPTQVAREAMENARSLCRIRYGVAPEVAVFGAANLTFTYVPSHLHHMLFELLKNSMRAVVEFHRNTVGPLPTIRIIVSEGLEDVTIKVADEGGGVPRSGTERIWTYLYTTADLPDGDESELPYQTDFDAPMAGLGYGLPISRLYARHFGGDLQVISMEGYGTDAYLHLMRLGNAKEVLPKRLY
jgi:pyruvate dehydrogenase kinase 2/3/4